MIWFLLYCATAVACWIVGSAWLVLGWFSNAVFSLLSAGSVTFAAHRAVRSRRAPKKLEAALTAGQNMKDIRNLIVEWAFGDTPDSDDMPNAWMTGLFAYLPFVILSFKLLGFGIAAVFWRVILACLLGIPCSMASGAIAGLIAAQRIMFKRVKDLIKRHDPEAWNQMVKAWRDRRESRTVAAAREARPLHGAGSAMPKGFSNKTTGTGDPAMQKRISQIVSALKKTGTNETCNLLAGLNNEEVTELLLNMWRIVVHEDTSSGDWSIIVKEDAPIPTSELKKYFTPVVARTPNGSSITLQYDPRLTLGNYLLIDGTRNTGSSWLSETERLHPELVQQGIAPPLSVYRESLKTHWNLIYEGMSEVTLRAFAGPPDRKTNMSAAITSALSSSSTIGGIAKLASGYRNIEMWTYITGGRQLRLEVVGFKVARVLGWF